MNYVYVINLDERESFFADVREHSTQGDTVFEIHGFDIFEDGYMRHADDIEGLKSYLVYLGIMDKSDYLGAMSHGDIYE